MKKKVLFWKLECKRVICRITGKTCNYKNLSPKIGTRSMLSPEESNEKIRQTIMDGTPFFAGRVGGFELAAVVQYLEHRLRYPSHLTECLVNNAGLFNTSKEVIKDFAELYLDSAERLDLIGRHWNEMEDYIVEAYAVNAALTKLFWLEPWSAPQNPWSAALAGKKVLVIHPFIETIQSQYKRRKEIFPGTNILPEFELKTLKAVQTIAGEKDSRFETWFDALEWMYQEALIIDFDVAIIGCGAYGFPLAAKLKQAGKQAIHLAGATQLLFGIKGKRWEENEMFSYVQKYFNNAWVYPADTDKPKQASKVEGGCYW